LATAIGPRYVLPFTRMASSQPRAVPIAETWRSRASLGVRSVLDHERALALLCAVATAIVAFAPRISGGGFIADDWAEYAEVRFPTALGFHSSLDGVLQSAGSRIGAGLYWLASFSLFGAHSRLYSTLAALLAVVMAFSIYVLLRELRLSIAQSLAIMTLTIAAPNAATVRFWFTTSGSQLALALFFFGLMLALRAFSATGRRSLNLHLASWLLYALSAFYADLALPLMGATIFVYLLRARVAVAFRRWAFDLVIVIAGYLATLAFVNETQGFGKLPKALWSEHARLIGDQALTIFTKMVDPFSDGARALDLILLGALAVTGLLLSLSSQRSSALRRELGRWSIAFAVSLVAVVASFVVYVPAMLYYEPLGAGLPSHIDIVAAAPLVVGVFSVLMFARAVISELSSRIRPSLPRLAPPLVAVWFIVIFVTGIKDVRHNGHVWAVAADRNRHVLDTLTKQLPNPLPGSTVYTFGEAGTAAPGLPIFFSPFELTNAVKIAYNRGDIAAYPVVALDDVVNCAPQGITAVAGASPFNQPSSYGRSYFVDLPTGRYARITSRSSCIRALSVFHQGPYSDSTVMQWSV
jgi:hypothetical protein